MQRKSNNQAKFIRSSTPSSPIYFVGNDGEKVSFLLLTIPSSRDGQHYYKCVNSNLRPNVYINTYCYLEFATGIKIDSEFVMLDKSSSLTYNEPVNRMFFVLGERDSFEITFSL